VKRALTIVGATIGTGVVLVASTAAGALLHLNLPATRRLVTGIANQELASSLYGKVEVRRIGSLGPAHIGGVVATAATHDGKRVLLVEGLHARVRLPKLLWSLVAGGDTKVALSDLTIDHVDALLEQDEHGDLTIAQVFAPAKEGPPEPPKPASKSRLDLELESIRLNHAWIHGGLAAVPVLDADLDLAGAFRMTPDTTSVALRRLRLSTRGMQDHADLAAALEAYLVLPEVDPLDHLDGSITFVGDVGGVPFDVRGSMKEKQVDASIDLPSVRPEAVNRMIASAPLHEPASAHLEAHGTLPVVDPTLHVALGRGTIDVKGHAVLPMEGRAATDARVAITARDVDVHAVSTAPASRLGLDASAEAHVEGGAVRGTYTVHVLPGSIGKNPVPDVRLVGHATPAIVNGFAHVDEPGAPTELSFTLDVPRKIASFEAQAKAQLADVKRLGLTTSGRVDLHAGGAVRRAEKSIEAHVETSVDEVRHGDLALSHATLDGFVHGPLAAPVVAVNLAGSDLRAGSVSVPLFAASVAGRQDDAVVAVDVRGATVPSLALRARVRAKNTLEARDVELDVARDQDRLTAKIDRLRSKSGAIDVEGLRVEGAGDPLVGEAHVTKSKLAVKLRSGGLDVARIERIATGDAKIREGHASIDVDLTATKRGTDGHANLALRGGQLAEVLHGVDASLAASFAGRDVDVKLDASALGAGHVKVTTEGARLGGGLRDPKAFADAVGRVHAEADVELAKLRDAWIGDFPLEDTKGRVQAKIDVSREEVGKRPSLDFGLQTHGLAFTTKPSSVPNGDGTVTIVGKPFHAEGMDARAAAHLDAQSGEARLDANVHDAHGAVFLAKASTTLPMAALLGGGAREALLATRIKAHAEVPLRPLDDLPPAFDRPPAKGDVGLSLDVDGSAREPRVVLVARARNLRNAEDATPVPVTFDTAVTYDGKDARAQIVAVRPEGKVLDARADAQVSAHDLLAGGAPAWVANADVLFTKFPVGAVSPFAKEDIDGELNGKVTLRDLHKAARLDALLDLNKVNVEGAKFDHAGANVTLTDGKLVAAARIDQSDGYADARVRGAVKWGAEPAPTLDGSKGLEIGFVAKNFRAAAIAPFVQGAFSELDGRVNADTKIHVDPGLKNGRMDAAIAVDHGVFESPAIGEEFHDVKTKIIMRPWGTWRVLDLEASGVTGRMRASAMAHVDGFQLRDAEGHVRIAKKEEVPLTMQGVAMGSAWGAVDVTAKAQQNNQRIDLDVHVPELHVDLPQSTSHSVQSLTPDPTIKVGVHERDGRMAILPMTEDEAKKAKAAAEPKADEKPSATPPPPKTTLHVTTHLDDVEVKRDTTIKIEIKGHPTVDLDDTTKVSGSIGIPQGFFEVQGKRFKIEKGTVNFTGQPPDDPVVIATAMYEAPDGTRIYADFVGPVKTGKITLRSEPQLSQNEILSVLLFGSADGTFGSSPPPGQEESGAAKAAGLAGGVVTQGLNKAINGVSDVEVTTRVDTSESNNPRPEVTVSLTKTVSATVIYNLGQPPPGQNPDDALVTVDWRLHKGWSLAVTEGDRGTSIADLTWKYRY
jgi:translocation and assembly module TamB